MSTVIDIQQRFTRLGEIRLGAKTDKGLPKRLSTFRLTSASKFLLDSAAALYGGEVREWVGAPNEGTWELFTTTSELDIAIPRRFSSRDGSPTAAYSQYYEMWSGGGCQRRCDGVTELLTDAPCACIAEGCEPDERACDIMTRIEVMLPRVPHLGIWLLTTSGWNAAATLPGTLDLLFSATQTSPIVPAILRIEPRVRKVAGETHRFVVPVIDLPNFRLQDLIDASAAAPPLQLVAPSEPPSEPPIVDAQTDVVVDAQTDVVVNAPPPRPTEQPPIPEAPIAPSSESLSEAPIEPEIGAAPPLPVDAQIGEAIPLPDVDAKTPLDATDEREELTTTLLALATQLGVHGAVLEHVTTNRERHAIAGTPELHVKWLQTQVASASDAVTKKEATT